MKINPSNLLGIFAMAAALPIASAQTAAPSKNDQSSKPKANVAAPKPAAKAPAPGVVVFKDPVTGQIRQPDASEIGELLQSGPLPSNSAVVGGGGLQMIQGPGNAVGVRLDDSFMTSVVVTKGSDGKLVMECIEGDKNAAALATNPVVKAVKPAAKKEALDEK